VLVVEVLKLLYREEKEEVDVDVVDVLVMMGVEV